MGAMSRVGQHQQAVGTKSLPWQVAIIWNFHRQLHELSRVNYLRPSRQRSTTGLCARRNTCHNYRLETMDASCSITDAAAGTAMIRGHHDRTRVQRIVTLARGASPPTARVRPLGRSGHRWQEDLERRNARPSRPGRRRAQPRPRGWRALRCLRSRTKESLHHESHGDGSLSLGSHPFEDLDRLVSMLNLSACC